MGVAAERGQVLQFGGECHLHAVAGRGFVQGLRDPVDALDQLKAQTQATIGLPGAADASASTDADIRAAYDWIKARAAITETQWQSSPTWHLVPP